ncbi:DUF2637 domain-containing protein [Streptomyces sp. NPDC056713]|uniref:DUF2637 domain-containing protein n=1 Tax=Streptomyces sp. NPDC056713 TaxID=3345921 RepID=UPI0036796D4F
MVVAGAVVIAGIGFAGSYAAVRSLALQKGFGNFSYVFPIGIDAGICVLLALDLLLTWIRIPFPLLRQTAWLLTAATIAFNGAAAWPDPLGVGMHAVIPILFVVSVEAARHAVGRIADITADKHMEGVRLTRWLLSPLPTFLLWRRMKLWELRSYEAVIKLEQDRLVYQARLHSRFGRAWRRKAPVESLMPLRLARYGVPLAQTAPAGLAAAGIEPRLLPAHRSRPPRPWSPRSKPQRFLRQNLPGRGTPNSCRRTKSRRRIQSTTSAPMSISWLSIRSCRRRLSSGTICRASMRQPKTTAVRCRRWIWCRSWPDMRPGARQAWAAKIGATQKGRRLRCQSQRRRGRRSTGMWPVPMARSSALPPIRQRSHSTCESATTWTLPSRTAAR